MLATGCDEQTEERAESLNGESTSAPFTGLFTVTAANAGREKEKIDIEANDRSFAMFIGFL